MEIGEVSKNIAHAGKNVTKKLGKSALPIGLGVGGLVLILMLLKGNSSVNRTELVTPTGYTSYPDAVTNANVIMSEVNNNTRVEVDRVIDKIDDTHITMIDRFDTTDNLVQDGIQSILDNAAENQGNVMGAITDAKGDIIGTIQTSEQTIITSMGEKMDSINEQISSQLSTNLSNFNVSNTITNPVTSVSNSLKSVLGKPVVANTSNLKSKSVGVDITKYYSKLQKNHKTLKEALDIRGITSTLSARKKIAAANGINNYTGTAAQDKKLLELWKKGKLVKA